MKILVSNDDGVYAPGIRSLAKRLSEDKNNEVYVVAPDRERSATGHAVTLHKPLRVEDADIEGNFKMAVWTTGTPSDCIKLALGALLGDVRPDLVVSGINNGANLGGDVLYSGTISAAREGALLGIPSIAVSVAGSSPRNFEVASEYISQLIKNLPTQNSGKFFLNVNVPNLPAEKIVGARLSRLGINAYTEYFEKRIDPRGKVYYWLAGESNTEGEEEGTDCWCIHHNYISVTPLSFGMTDEELLGKLNGWQGLETALGATSISLPEPIKTKSV